MSERNWRLFLKDISECSGRILDYTNDMTREEFFDDRKTVDAVMRNLAIIGDAAKKIPTDVRRKKSGCGLEEDGWVTGHSRA